MPFQSKAQVGKMAVLQKEGKLKAGTFTRWAHETPNIKGLPERVGAPHTTHAATPATHHIHPALIVSLTVGHHKGSHK